MVPFKSKLLLTIGFLMILQAICIGGGTSSTHLQFAGSWPFGDADAIALDSERGLVFLGSGGGVLVLDVGDPTNPVLLSDTIRTRGFVQELAYDAARELLFVDGDFAYVSRAEELYLFDVSNPANPIERDDVELPEGIGCIMSRGTEIFAVEQSAGVLVYKNGLKDPALQADTTVLSATTGGQVDFTLIGGAEQAARNYLLLAGLAGTVPGTLLPGGRATIPLNRDWFTDFVLGHLNGALFVDFYGTLNAAGEGVARLDTLGPFNSYFVGRTLHFAWAATAPLDFTSNAVAIEVVP